MPQLKWNLEKLEVKSAPQTCVFGPFLHCGRHIILLTKIHGFLAEYFHIRHHIASTSLLSSQSVISSPGKWRIHTKPSTWWKTNIRRSYKWAAAFIDLRPNSNAYVLLAQVIGKHGAPQISALVVLSHLWPCRCFFIFPSLDHYCWVLTTAEQDKVLTWNLIYPTHIYIPL